MANTNAHVEHPQLPVSLLASVTPDRKERIGAAAEQQD
jgi:hypothetical protein